MFKTYSKTKKEPVRTENTFRNFKFFWLQHEYFDSFSYFRFFQFLQALLLISERCSPTKRGVHPPSFQSQRISLHLGALQLCLQQETKKNGRYDCNDKEKT